MIEVIYERSIPRVTIKGHAGSGEVGHDLVCAAASILACTLASHVDGMKDSERVQFASVELNGGDSRISCEPKENYVLCARLIFDTIGAGFDILAQEYPENITFEIENLIGELQKYSDAIKKGDREELEKLLAEGTKIKESIG